MDSLNIHCGSHYPYSFFKWWLLFFSNDSTDGEPEEKRRKIANVVINQSANDSKVLIDNIPDSSSLIEEVQFKCPEVSFKIVCNFFILMCQWIIFNNLSIERNFIKNLTSIYFIRKNFNYLNLKKLDYY